MTEFLLRKDPPAQAQPSGGRRFSKKLKSLLVFNHAEELPEAQSEIQPYDIEEIKALHRFVIDRGLEVDSTVISNLTKSISLASSKAPTDEEEQELIRNYHTLTAISYAKYRINGRTVKDSACFSATVINSANFWGILLFILALLPNLLYLWVSDDSRLLRLIEFLSQLAPFFWGGIGSVIFLIKSLSEIAAASRFDRRRLHGVTTRIFLGASLAYVVVTMLQGTDFLAAADLSQSLISVEATRNAVAFLTGLGTKAVYGMLENLIETVAEKFSKKEKLPNG